MTMLVTQSGPTIPAPFYPAGETAIGHAVLQLDGSVALGLGHFAADSFNASGFDSLTLQGTVQFSGAVTLNANRALNVGSGGVIFGDAAINLNAPYVALGMAFQPPAATRPNSASPFTVGGRTVLLCAAVRDGHLECFGAADRYRQSLAPEYRHGEPDRAGWRCARRRHLRRRGQHQHYRRAGLSADGNHFHDRGVRLPLEGRRSFAAGHGDVHLRPVNVRCHFRLAAF